MNRYDRRLAAFLFGGVFVYVLVTGGFIQFVVLPHFFPDLHAGDGLLRGLDTFGFHHEALLMVQRMHSEGWSAWVLRPDGGNSPPGIMAAVYYLLVPHLYVLLPLNGILWGLTATIWLSILRRLFPEIQAWALVGALVVIGFPSSFTWITQFHKDLFTIPGCSLILYALVWGATDDGEPDTRVRNIIWLAGMLTVGSLLVWLVRPYLLQLVAASSLAAFSIALFKRLPVRALGFVGFVTLLTMVASVIGNHWGGTQGTLLDLTKSAGQAYGDIAADKGFTGILDQKVRQIGQIRRGYCSGYANMGSAIDCDQRMNTMTDGLMYLPRAIQIAVLSPFPDTWFAMGKTPGGTQMRMVAGVETGIAYIIFTMVSLLMLSGRIRLSVPVLMALVFLLVPAIIQAYANPNLGTVYRMRYVFWTGLIAIALCLVIGYWLELRKRSGKQ